MIVRLWRGEIELWKTFWLFGVGGIILIELPAFLFMLSLADLPYKTTKPIFIFLSLFLFIFPTYLFTGIWRAASNYQGNRAWSLLAKLIVVIEAVKILPFMAFLFIRHFV